MTTATLSNTSLHPTTIDLPNTTREQLVNLLNTQLAQLIDLRLQTKTAHWNVKGMHFIALHQLFDALVTALDEPIDDVAERASTLGGTAHGLLHHVSAHTMLPPLPLSAPHHLAGETLLKALIERLATVANTTRQAIDQADTWGDADTADLFTGVSRLLDKQLWFLEAHVQ